MINILTEDLPSYILVSDKQIEINTDFKLWINFIQSSVSEDNTNLLKSILAILKDKETKIDNNLLEAMCKFILIAEHIGKEPNNSSSSNNINRIFDFKKDSDCVFADFIRFYNINLIEKTMHWLEFKTLFNMLPENSATEQRKEIRSKNVLDVEPKYRGLLISLKNNLKIEQNNNLIFSKDKSERLEKRREYIKNRISNINERRELCQKD